MFSGNWLEQEPYPLFLSCFLLCLHPFTKQGCWLSSILLESRLVAEEGRCVSKEFLASRDELDKVQLNPQGLL